MTSMSRCIIYGFILFWTHGCVERYTPEVDTEAQNLYSVDGDISDVCPAKVFIEHASSYDDIHEDVSGATVTVVDDLGQREVLTDLNNGYYVGTQLGRVGRYYSLEITLPKGNKIVSAPELLKPSSPEFELSKEQSIRHEISDAGYNIIVEGIDINLSMNQSDVLSTYYYWTFQETYPLSDPSISSEDVCFLTENIWGQFVLGESISLSVDVFSQNLIFLENQEKFAYGYSLEVIQHAISSRCFEYWSKVNEQINQVGSVFDPPPAQVIGNLRFVDTDQVPVLGFFEVYSIKRKRIYVDPQDFRIPPERLNSDIFCDSDYFCDETIWCYDCELYDTYYMDKSIPSFW